MRFGKGRELTKDKHIYGVATSSLAQVTESELSSSDAATDAANVAPVLYLVIPCFNEESVLPVTAPIFRQKLLGLRSEGKIAEASRILFVDDGSRDGTWQVITTLAGSELEYEGLRLSRNRGHQNALLAGLMDVRNRCDITISIDCDGQDDVEAMDAMVDAYLEGCDVVYGVRSSRQTDTAFKRGTAHAFYRLMEGMGVETVYDHADYRLMSSRALEALGDFREVNLFLRGMVPLVGFRSTSVAYERHERVAGQSHYPLSKMVALAVDGITSLSIKPIRLITAFGLVASLVGLAGIVWAVVAWAAGATVSGWASMTVALCFFGGMQTLSLGVVGEYVGKTYLEAKHRPRFVISDRTEPGSPVRDC